MQKMIMFEDVPNTVSFMLPDGTIKGNAQIVADYPILGTPFGVIGLITASSGEIPELCPMGSVDNINILRPMYVEQGAEITPEMTNAQACVVITEFINTPRPTEEEEALDAYLNL